MTDIRAKIIRISGEAGGRRRAIISACVMIAVSVAMFFIAFFAPFRYYSDQDVLHVIYIDSEQSESTEVRVFETRRVHQSLFRIFEAATALEDASILHAASIGTITDEREYEAARERLNELRKQYSDIVTETTERAVKEGVSLDSDGYIDMIADALSDMNLIALDMLETAYTSDNTGSYEAVYTGIALGTASAVMNLLIMVVSIVALAFSIFAIVSPNVKNHNGLFFRLLTVPSAASLTLCVFNPIMPPASAPLALACTSTIMFYVSGLARSVASDMPTAAVVKNAIVGALVPAAMLCLAIVPSFTIYVTGLGGKYLFYPGTVGTVFYSRISAMIEIGLEIPKGPMTLAFVMGIMISIASIACAIAALHRQYYYSNKKFGLLPAALAATAVIGIAFVIAVAAVTSDLVSSGKLVRYIAGASWYVNIALMTACAVFMTVGGLLADKSDATKKTVPNAAAEAEAENAENTDAENGENTDTVNSDDNADNGTDGVAEADADKQNDETEKPSGKDEEKAGR